MKLIRLSVVIAVAGAAVLLAPAHPAAAHVTVSPSTATVGGRGTFAFKVPNERDNAATTRLEVIFPENASITSASVRPLPGWSTTISTRKLPVSGTASSGHGDSGGEAVTGIVWQGGAIKPGEFQTFDVSMGPLPRTPGKLIFKALQTYSNGEVVRWIDVAEDGAPRPDHPAPVITVEEAAANPVPVPTPAGDGTARALGVTGLGLGLLALALSLAALVRRRRPVTAPPSRGEAGRSRSDVDIQPDTVDEPAVVGTGPR